MALAAAIAVGSVWIGLATAYVVPHTPPSFAILAVASLSYAAATGYRRLTERQAPASMPAVGMET
jgi:hypothetical protein